MRLAGLLMFAVILFAPALVPTSARSDTCVRFESGAGTVSFSLVSEGLRRGISPMEFCSVKSDHKYGVVVESQGRETRSFKFVLRGSDQTIRLSANRLNYVSRSLVLPGWGQGKLGHRDEAGWAFTLTVGSLIYLGNAAYEYSKAVDESDRLDGELASATTQTDIESWSALSAQQTQETQLQKDYLIEVGAYAGYIYLSNLVETWLWATPPKRTVNGNTVIVSTPEKTNLRAALRSMVFPGMGQKYVGSSVKGQLFQSAFLIMGIGVIESRKDYEQALSSYDEVVAELANAGSVDDATAIESLAASQWDQVLRKERHRNAWYIAAGSVWLMNVLDAALSNTLANQAPGFFETSFSGKTIRTGVNVRF